MKRLLTGLAGAATLLTASAQIVIPPMPGKGKVRPIGGGTDGGVEVIPKPDPTVRYTTHIVLSASRLWTSTEGKPLEGKLIAFEDLIVETPKGATEPTPPKPPEHPTVVREDKVRLLVNKKAVIVPLSRLSQADRDFIGKIRKEHEVKTPPAP